MSRLNANEIENDLGTTRLGRNVLCFQEVDSTNDVAWSSARQAGADGLVIFAESQRRGRGRQGRKWVSPIGRNLLFSVLLCDDVEALSPEAVTIAAGLAVAEAIEQETPLHAELKWPNDVLIGGAKAAGILVERRVENGTAAMVIGLGVNVAATPPAEDVDQPTVSLAAAAGEVVNRTTMARVILQRLDDWLGRIARRNLTELHDAWMEHCGMLHQRVRAVSAGTEYIGRVVDVSPLRGLELIDDHGLHVYLPAVNTSLSPRKNQ